MFHSQGSDLGVHLFELTFGVRDHRCFLHGLGCGCAAEIVELVGLDGVPLFGGIVALVHFELVIVLAQFVATRFLADFGAALLTAGVVVVLAIGDLGNIKSFGISSVILF